MKIVIIVEGRTEQVFVPILRLHLEQTLAGRMPRLACNRCDGRIPTGERLARLVRHILERGPEPVDHVLALTDVYTGTREFVDAADARSKMLDWVDEDLRPRFHPHAAQFDFEAWLIPFWDRICALAGHTQKKPNGNPEAINHDQPPSNVIKALFRRGTKRDYVKARDAPRILRDQDLSIAIAQCAQLREFVTSIIELCGPPATAPSYHPNSRRRGARIRRSRR